LGRLRVPCPTASRRQEFPLTARVFSIEDFQFSVGNYQLKLTILKISLNTLKAKEG